MQNSWATVKLDDILECNLDAVDVVPTESYKFAGVYCFGKGLFEREDLLGANTSYKYFNRLQKNHITISKVKGWEGAIALIDEKFEGLYLSPQYPTFRSKDTNTTEINYVHQFLMQETVWKKLLGESVGIGARRNSISEDKFLNLSIPLPPLEEQKRIVARLENIKQRIEQIRKLRAEQEKEINNFSYSYFHDLILSFGESPLSECLSHRSAFIQIDDNKNYKLCRVQTKALGVVLREIKSGIDIKTKSQQVCKAGEFLVAEMDARFGGYGIVPEELNDSIVSSHYFLFTLNPEMINTKYLEYFSQTKWFHSQVEAKGSTNYAAIRAWQVLNYKIPLPPIEEQNRIVALLDKLNTIKAQHKKQEQELTQLMPALLDKAFKGEL